MCFKVPTLLVVTNNRTILGLAMLYYAQILFMTLAPDAGIKGSPMFVKNCRKSGQSIL